MTAVSSYVMFMHYMSLFTSHSHKGHFEGKLSTQCNNHYYRLFVEKWVTPRSFKFWHEVQPPNGESYRIVGGKNISIEDAPYTVMYGPWCAGTLIAPDWVLTAAHCKDKFEFVSVGSTYLSQGEKHNICMHFFHPGWSAKNRTHKMDWDYQLLLLETPVMVSDRARPIAISTEEFMVPYSIITISGWGHTTFKDSPMEEMLRKVELPVVNQTECAAVPLMQYQHITPRMFCAGQTNGQRDACQGDSGGPAVQYKQLVGSVSFGVGCGLPGIPGVYALVSKAKPWIQEITALPYL